MSRPDRRKRLVKRTAAFPRAIADGLYGGEIPTIGRTDADGRFCLNDLHRASGGEKRHAPNEWLRNKQTSELLDELSKPGIPGMAGWSPLSVAHGGAAPGTYVAKELVYAYAMWISPAFHLKVIRAYDAMVSKPARLLPL